MKTICMLAFPAAGAVLGTLLGHFGKCASGACPLTSTPWRGALYGAVVAGVLGLSACTEAREPSNNAATTGEEKAPKNLVHVQGQEEFDAATSKGLVLVDFSADWCGPCKKLGPVLEKIAAANSDSLVVAKVDVNDNKALARKYGVRGIPHLILMRDGKIVDKTTGYRGEKQMRKWLAPHLEENTK